MSKLPHRQICGLCHRVCVVDFRVPNDVWAAVVHDHYAHSIHCINCFAERADERLIDWGKDIKLIPNSLRRHVDKVLTPEIERRLEDYPMTADHVRVRPGMDLYSVVGRTTGVGLSWAAMVEQTSEDMDEDGLPVTDFTKFYASREEAQRVCDHRNA